MKRITEKDLQSVVDRINRVTGSPMEYSQPREAGKPFCCNVNHYCLDFAYDGVTLHRVANTSGGAHNVLGCGYLPKRELYERMHAFIRGLDAK